MTGSQTKDSPSCSSSLSPSIPAFVVLYYLSSEEGRGTEGPRRTEAEGGEEQSSEIFRLEICDAQTFLPGERNVVRMYLYYHTSITVHTFIYSTKLTHMSGSSATSACCTAEKFFFRMGT